MTVRKVDHAIIIPRNLISVNAMNNYCFFIIFKKFKLLRSQLKVYNLERLTGF
jgi:hypothetical protein